MFIAPTFHLPTPTGAESWIPEEDNTSADKKMNAPFNRVRVMAGFVWAWPGGVVCLLLSCTDLRSLGFAVIEVACFYYSG